MPVDQHASSAATAMRLDLPVRSHRLENGLKVLIHEDHTVRSLALNLVFKVGSRNEQAGTTGLAHFFEHMMFNGSKDYAPGSFDRIMEAHGASNNAYTTKDVTVYQDWCPPEALGVVLDLEADRMARLALDPIMVESERGVVANERRRYMAEPESILDELLYTTAFTAHPYRWPILGWMVDILNWRISDLEDFYRTYYSPNNAVLVIAGAVEAEEVIAAVEQRFAGLEARGAPRPIHTREPAQRGERRARVAHPSDLAQVQMGWHIPSTSHADYWALSVLEKLLFQGPSSVLVQRLVERDEVALHLHGGIDWNALDPTLFTLRAHLRQGHGSARLEAILREELTTLREQGVAPELLARARNQVRVEFLRALKTLSGKADLLGGFEVFGKGHEELERALEFFSSVRSEDVQRVLEDYFVDDNRSVVELDPARAPTLVQLGPGLAGPLGVKPPSDEDERPLTAAEERAMTLPESSGEGLSFPASDRVVLANGLTVHFLERRSVPLVTWAFAFDAGGIHVSDDQLGLAPICARLMRKGTRNYSDEELSAAVDALGGFLGTSVGKFPMRVAAEFLGEHTETGLALLSEVIRYPTFPEKELVKARRRGLDAIRNDRSAARSVVDRFFIGSLFAGHPLGRPTSGDEWSLEGLDRDAVIAHHGRLVTPGNATLAIVGDFQTSTMRELVEATFGDWQGAAPPSLVLPEPEPLRESRVLLVEKEDADDVVFQFGRPALPRLHPDFPLVSLLNVLLGGRFTSRLNTALRIREGLTYGVSSGFLDFRDTGVFRVESFSAAETSERAIDLALEECRRFHAEGVTEEELRSAKAYLRGQFPLDLETNEQLAEMILFLETRGLDGGTITRHFERIEGLELEQANALVREHFAMDAVQMVLVGAPGVLDRYAGKYGPVTRVPIRGSRFTPPWSPPGLAD